MTADDFPRPSEWFKHPRVSRAARACRAYWGPPPNCSGRRAAWGATPPLEPGGYLCADCAALPTRPVPPFCAVCSRAFADDGTPPGRTATAPAPIAARKVSRSSARCIFAATTGWRATSSCASSTAANITCADRWPAGSWKPFRPTNACAAGRWTRSCPCPCTGARERERGFNQAEALCRRVSHGTGVPVWRALRRVRATRTQTHLSREQRQGNLRGAFVAAPRRPVAGAHLLLWTTCTRPARPSTNARGCCAGRARRACACSRSRGGDADGGLRL